MRSFQTTLPMSGSEENDIPEVSIFPVDTQPGTATSNRATIHGKAAAEEFRSLTA